MGLRSAAAYANRMKHHPSFGSWPEPQKSLSVCSDCRFRQLPTLVLSYLIISVNCNLVRWATRENLTDIWMELETGSLGRNVIMLYPIVRMRWEKFENLSKSLLMNDVLFNLINKRRTFLIDRFIFSGLIDHRSLTIFYSSYWRRYLDSHLLFNYTSWYTRR